MGNADANANDPFQKTLTVGANRTKSGVLLEGGGRYIPGCLAIPTSGIKNARVEKGRTGTPSQPGGRFEARVVAGAKVQPTVAASSSAFRRAPCGPTDEGEGATTCPLHPCPSVGATDGRSDNAPLWNRSPSNPLGPFATGGAGPAANRASRCFSCEQRPLCREESDRTSPFWNSK